MHSLAVITDVIIKLTSHDFVVQKKNPNFKCTIFGMHQAHRYDLLWKRFIVGFQEYAALTVLGAKMSFSLTAIKDLLSWKCFTVLLSNQMTIYNTVF